MIREAETHCTAMIKDAETHCAAMIKEAETHCAMQAYILEQSHEESLLRLEGAVLTEEGGDFQAFMEACGTALWACPFTAHGVLMYPLQLLTGNVPLAIMLATTPQLATVGRELLLTAFIPTLSRMVAPPTGTKWWCWLSDQEAMMPRPEEEEAAILDVTVEEHPHWRRPLVRLLKENHQEVFKKDWPHPSY